jgi:hypothetical protein
VNPRTRSLRAATLLAAGALTLGGCSGGGEAADAPSPSTSPSPSTTVSVPADVSVTEQGTELRFGQTATVIFEPTQNRGTVLDLTVKKARQGRLTDFRGFILDDDYKKNANYYYVDVSVKNVGEGEVGGVPVPLWGVHGENTQRPAVSFTTGFAKCESEALPEKFGPGDTLDTCLVYLSPEHGSLDAVSYRPNQAFNPIRWTGDVVPPEEPAKKDQKRGDKKD